MSVKRNRTRPPHKPGWYYGIRLGMPSAEPLRVVCVPVPGNVAKQLRVLLGNDHLLLQHFEWYGQVPSCVIVEAAA